MTSDSEIERLNGEWIRQCLNPVASALLRELEVHESIDSTSAELQRRDHPGEGAVVCLAEQQTAGRGRRGRSWVSPLGRNIYCSVAWQERSGIAALQGLSLLVGVVLCDALQGLGVDGLSLKWPNDVLRDGRKLAGILIEVQSDPSGPATAIIGVGVNVAMPSQAAEAIDQPWTDLRSAASSHSRNVIVGQFMNGLLPALAELSTQGFAAYRDRWMDLDAYAGQAVVVHSSEQRIAGTARGVDGTGALLLETASGMQTIHGGEVSLRPVT